MLYFPAKSYQFAVMLVSLRHKFHSGSKIDMVIFLRNIDHKFGYFFFLRFHDEQSGEKEKAKQSSLQKY